MQDDKRFIRKHALQTLRVKTSLKIKVNNHIKKVALWRNVTYAFVIYLIF